MPPALRRLVLPVGALLCLLLTAAASHAQTVTVRSGEHEAYSRLVFDVQGEIGFQLSARADGATIRFDQPLSLDLSGVSADRLSRIGQVSPTDSAGETAALEFRARQGRGIDIFRLDGRIVLDVYDSVDDARAAAGERRRLRRELGRELAAGIVLPVEAGAEGSVGRDQTAADLPDPSADMARRKSPDTMPDDRPDTGKGVPGGEEGLPIAFPDRFDAVTMSPQSDSYKRIEVSVTATSSGLAMDFDFEDDRYAAVFTRAGYLWIVFSGLIAYDLSALDFDSAALTGRLTDVQRLRTQDVSALRFKMALSQGVSVRQMGTKWRVEVKDDLVAPLRPLRLVRREGPEGGQIFIPVEDSFRKVQVTDPAVGDRLAVVAVKEPNRGVRDGRKTPAFSILPTAQGIAVVGTADRARVRRFNNGVAISAQSEDAFTTPQTAGEEGQGMGDLAGEPPARLLDLEAWRLVGDDQFNDKRAELVARIADLPDQQRNEGRWDLARFLLAHDQAAEARGVLELMVNEDEGLLNSAQFRAVRGVVNQMLNRSAPALDDLSHPRLSEDPDANLWKLLAAESESQPTKALEAYRLGKDRLGYYDPAQQAQFLLAAARAALMGERVDQAGRILELLEPLEVGPSITGEATLLRARLAAKRGDIAKALDLFEKAIASPDPRASALARLERVRFALRHEGLSKAEAVEELESLRFDWRGREFEIDILSTLGQLYVSIGEYRKGLETMRQVVEYYPNDPRTGRVVRRMQEIFETIFLESNQQELSPFDAVALFQDFRELTPQGAAGDRIIRRLVDRLVAVDLLGRAADLLRYQVTYRLEGAAQAQIAGRLAMVHLLDRKPEKALEVLRATRSGRLPDEIRRQRRFVEARALTALERYEEAEAMLEGFGGKAAETLRADIFWEAKNWSRVAQQHRRLLANRPDDKELTTEERLGIVRQAVALMHMDDQPGLRELRQEWGVMMRDGPFEQLFEELTAQRALTAGSTKELAQKVADVDAFRSFLDAYRTEFSEDTVAERQADDEGEAPDNGAEGGGPAP